MSDEQSILMEPESIKCDATIDCAMNRRRVVLTKRPRWRRMLRAPHIFAAHYRICGSLRGAWALTLWTLR